MESDFVWTEENSKRLKIKVTISKDVGLKNAVQRSFLIEYIVDWIQCDDCRKQFTPHTWTASVQVRQKVDHKRTFLLLEQMIIRYKMQDLILNMIETKEGADFHFKTRSQAITFKEFVKNVLLVKERESKKLISQDHKSNTQNFKYSYYLEIAAVSFDDLIFFDKKTARVLGGVNQVYLCTKITNKIHLLDPLSFQRLTFDVNNYHKHNFKATISRDCMSLFTIVDVEPAGEFAPECRKIVKIKRNVKTMTDESTEPIPNERMTDNSKVTVYKPKNHYYLVSVMTMNKNGEQEVFDGLKLFWEGKIYPGDVFYGYDVRHLNLPSEIEDEGNANDRPDVVLVKKQYKRTNKRRIWKLGSLPKEEEKVLSKKEEEKHKRDYEMFMRDIEEKKGLRSKVQILPDEDAIRELESKMQDLGFVEQEQDSELDIDLEKMNLNEEDEDLKEVKLGKRNRQGEVLEEDI